MKLKEFCSYLDSAVPLSIQETYDNSGLQLGMPESEISSVMISLDVTEDVIDEAILCKCDLIISHHPLIFEGIKRITSTTTPERVIHKAIKNNIAIYSSHTNLDIFWHGVSRKMAEKLNLQNVKVLSPLKNCLLKLVTYIPEKHLDSVRNAVYSAGAGVIGKYDYCGFVSDGTGSFRPGGESNPYVGERGTIHFEKEIRFETILFTHLKDKVIKALHAAHPYEEVAYDLYSLENENVELGLGCVGELNEIMVESDFLNMVSSVFGAKGVRYSKFTGKNIRKIALCGGSGASLLNKAIAAGADVYITSDVKYHNYFDAENKILLVDIGHFESEKFASEILYELIIKKFPKFAVRFSETNTNPINYL
jgi:dinuclear metal center YbgI/SA1388 family protein